MLISSLCSYIIRFRQLWVFFCCMLWSPGLRGLGCFWSEKCTGRGRKQNRWGAKSGYMLHVGILQFCAVVQLKQLDHFTPIFHCWSNISPVLLLYCVPLVVPWSWHGEHCWPLIYQVVNSSSHCSWQLIWFLCELDLSMSSLHNVFVPHWFSLKHWGLLHTSFQLSWSSELSVP